MKQETKELIKWITSVLAYCPYSVLSDFLRVNADEKVELAIDFLCSLPEVESHLCKGGYIQDRNGTPCCDGDKVKIIRGGDLPPHITTLRFDTETRSFVIGMPVFGENKEVDMWLERHKFEKVEK